MRISFLILTLFYCFRLGAQTEHGIHDSVQSAVAASELRVTNDSRMDVVSYLLQLSPSVDSAFLSATARILAVVTEATGNLVLDFHSDWQISAVLGADAYLHDGDSLMLLFDDVFEPGQLMDVSVSYSGVPPIAGGVKGLRYETHQSSVPVIASLSTPFLAHYWYPCKDGPYDKADSVFVDISLPKTLFGGRMLTGVSNGLLDSVSDTSNERIFHWSHRYPIVPYYVMLAVSDFVLISETYCSPETDECFPLEYYVFPSDSIAAIQGTDRLPEVMQLFEELFGPYPFVSEKYGMTQLGFYGAIENQTNTITNSMDQGWFMISVHELAHMWYGCQVTCSSWNHGWLNEGFATYAEALWIEHDEGAAAYRNYMAQKAWYSGGTVFLPEADNPFGVFLPIIYRKGAWVLHMLRFVMGDESFFDMLRNYAWQPEFSYSGLNTEEFRAYCESWYGYELDWFFDQWVYDAYYPAFYYNFEQENDKLHLQVFQAQGQLGRRPVFETPMQWKISFQDQTDTLLTLWHDVQNQYYVLEGLAGEVVSLTPDPNQWLLFTAQFVPDLPVGLPEAEHSDVFVVYPNPASSMLFIRLAGIDAAAGMLVEFVQSNGQLSARLPLSGSEMLVDVSQLPEGTYLLRLRNAAGSYLGSQKIIRK
jgi:aminopeptidase N